jgi:hypothetical protein
MNTVTMEAILFDVDPKDTKFDQLIEKKYCGGTS